MANRFQISTHFPVCVCVDLWGSFKGARHLTFCKELVRTQLGPPCFPLESHLSPTTKNFVRFPPTYVLEEQGVLQTESKKKHQAGRFSCRFGLVR